MTDVYPVRNDSGGALDLADFGITIPDTVKYDLGSFDKAILSSVVQALIQSDDLVKVISGVDIPKANALFHNLLFEAVRDGDESHNFVTFQDELVLSIPGASDDELRIYYSIEYENDTKDKLTELELLVGATVIGGECSSFTDKDKGNPKTFSGYCDFQFTGAQDLKFQSKVDGGTITTRNVRLTVEVK